MNWIETYSSLVQRIENLDRHIYSYAITSANIPTSIAYDKIIGYMIEKVKLEEELDKYKHLLDGLDPIDRKILKLKYLNGFTNKQVAKQLNIGERTVYRHLSNCSQVSYNIMRRKDYGRTK